jgi:hypothetical protein
MITVRLVGGVIASVNDGVWTCDVEDMVGRLNALPDLAIGYFIIEDDRLATNAVLVFGGERVSGTSEVIDTAAPEGAVH